MPKQNHLPSIAALRRQFSGLPRVALSIRQPYAHFTSQGWKDVENRTWKTSFRGPVLIHASGKPETLFDEDLEIIQRYHGVRLDELSFDNAPLGGIVGVAEIVDCVTHSSSPWFCGPFGFVLRNARPLPFVRMNGRLGIWKVGKEGLQ